MHLVDDEREGQAPTASSCIAWRIVCLCSDVQHFCIHKSAKIGRKDRWMRDDEGGLGMYHACSTGDSLADDVSTGRSSELGPWA